jgi:tight adherence protein B
VEAGLADLLALVAAPLRAGIPPSSSVAAAASAVAGDRVVGDLARRLGDAGRGGDDVSEVWRSYDAGGEAAAFVARAWALSDRTGAPLADALGAAEQVLRARQRTRQRLAGAAAGPRASMVVLTLLPLSGPVVGLACGIAPRELYLESPFALASLALGLVLALVAWTWSRAILARAAA